MNPRIIVVLSLLAGLSVPSGVPAQVIDYTKVRQYVGEEVTVEGPVARAERARGGGLVFSLGKSYSRRTLEVIIRPEFVGSFEADIRYYEGKTVQVQGRISTGEAEGLQRGGAGSSTIPAITLRDAGRFKVIIAPPEKKPGSS